MEKRKRIKPCYVGPCSFSTHHHFRSHNPLSASATGGALSSLLRSLRKRNPSHGPESLQVPFGLSHFLLPFSLPPGQLQGGLPGLAPLPALTGSMYWRASHSDRYRAGRRDSYAVLGRSSGGGGRGLPATQTTGPPERTKQSLPPPAAPLPPKPSPPLHSYPWPHGLLSLSTAQDRPTH